MKFSIRLNNDLAFDQYLEMVQVAESAGFDQFWVSHDLFLRSSAAILAACAQVTERIELGTCILNPYTLHPAEIAMAAATLAEISRDRFNLGLAAGAENFLNWVGIEQTKPLSTMRQTIINLRKLFAGEAVDGWSSEAYLRVIPRRPPPIYLGATSPGMLRLAGELADGVLPLLFPPEHLATVAPLVAEGASKAGRSLEEIDLAACIWCSVDPDAEAAAGVLRDKIAYYAPALSDYLRDRLGLPEDDLAAIDRALQVEKDPAKARAMITDPMLKIGVVGGPQQLLQRLEGLIAMGARHLSFGPPLGPDPVAAVRIIGREVLPALRGRA